MGTDEGGSEEGEQTDRQTDRQFPDSALSIVSDVRRMLGDGPSLARVPVASLPSAAVPMAYEMA